MQEVFRNVIASDGIGYYGHDLIKIINKKQE